MTTQPDYAYLNQLIKDFEILDAALLDEAIRGEFDTLNETLSAKLAVKKYVTQFPHIQARDILAIKLKKIRDDYGYNVDKIVAFINDNVDDKISQSQDDTDIFEAIYGEGTERYVGGDYFRRINEIGAIVASKELPANVITHLNRIKECYSLGLFEAATIYCRSLIEVSGFEFLVRKKIVTKGENSPAERRLSILLNYLRNRMDKFVLNETMKVVLCANMILHDKSKTIDVGEEDSLAHIQSTIAFVEYLYT